MALFRWTSIVLSGALVFVVLVDSAPAEAGVSGDASRGAELRGVEGIAPPAPDSPVDFASEAATAQQQAELSVWTPPASPATPLPEFVDPAAPWSRSVIAHAGAETGPHLLTFVVGQVPFAVDEITGNLVVGGEDVSLGGAGNSLTLDRIYDSGASASTALGTGWSTNFDRGIELDGSDAVFYSTAGIPVQSIAAADGGVKSPNGPTLTRVAESVDRTFLLTESSGESLYFSANGYLTADLDSAGRGVLARYDSLGRITLAAQTPSGRSVSFDYDGSKLTGVTDSAGRKTTYSEDDSGRLGSVLSSSGVTTTFSYDTSGRLTGISVPSAATESGTTSVVLAYDGRGRVASVAQESASLLWGIEKTSATSFRYDAGSTVVTNSLGAKTAFGFDVQHRLTRVTDPAGHVSKAQYDGDLVTSITDGVGATSTLQYDSSGRPVGGSTQGGATASIDYQSDQSCQSAGGDVSVPKCLVDAEGNRVSINYNGEGAVSDVRDGVGTLTQVGYSSDASTCMNVPGYVCSVTDGNGTSVERSYSATGDLMRVGTLSSLGGPLIGSTEYARDSLGRITSITRVGGAEGGLNAVTSISYDRSDRVVHVLFPDGSETWSGYNPEGTESFTFGRGVLTRYAYDSKGFLTEEKSATVAASGSSTGSFETITYDHDAAGNLTRRSDGSGTTTYTYESNLLTRIQEPGGNCNTRFGAADSGCVRFSYDANGREIRRLFPGGASQFTRYDSSGRTTGISSSSGKTAEGVSNLYSYSTAEGANSGFIQSRTSIVTSIPALAATGPAAVSDGVDADGAVAERTVTSYQYDARGRLIGADERNGTGKPVQASWAYTYDGAGNRLSQTRSGNTGLGTDATTPVSTIGYSYDRLNKITATTADTAAWSYDGLGNQTVNGISGGLTGDAATPPASSVSPSESSPNSFIVSPSGESIGFSDTSGSHYYGKDINGSVVAIFNEDSSFAGGYSYSPFGELRSASPTPAVQSNPIRYAGAVQDPAAPDTYRVGVRDYDASLGRFTQPDPSSLDARSYDYGLQNPINFVDRDGLNPLPIFVAGVAAFIVGLATYGICKRWPDSWKTCFLATAVLAFVGALAGSGISAYFFDHSVGVVFEDAAVSTGLGWLSGLTYWLLAQNERKRVQALEAENRRLTDDLETARNPEQSRRDLNDARVEMVVHGRDNANQPRIQGSPLECSQPTVQSLPAFSCNSFGSG